MASKPPSQASGQATTPTAGTKRKAKKPKVVSAVERTIKAIESLSPFD